MKIEKLYRDKEWLEKEIKKKSCYQIARVCQVTPMTIWNWLHRYRIPTQHQWPNHALLTKAALELLIGSLLGDGHIGRQSNISAGYCHTSSYKSYVEWLSKRLASFGISQAGKTYKGTYSPPAGEKYYTTFSYQSKSYVELKDLHSKWYRKARKDERWSTGRQKKWIKILPTDLKLTRLVCRQWYIDDGSLNKESDCITMCTQGFEVREVAFLVKLLGGLGFKAKRRKNNQIWISSLSTQDFLDYIGACPVKCYEYKWNNTRHKKKEARIRKEFELACINI